LAFLVAKYGGISPLYLSQFYGVGITEQYDPDYRLAKNRVIFPVYCDGVLRGWQGRTFLPDVDPRWYLPPGFNKVVARYNWDRVQPYQIPVLAEGIPAAIAAGPTGIAIFGKELSETACAEVAKRWKTVVIATDPETLVPDPRGNQGKTKVYSALLKARLDKYLELPAAIIRYPEPVIQLAHQKVNGQKVSVPDLADFGLQGTHQLLSALPHPWGRLSVM